MGLRSYPCFGWKISLDDGKKRGIAVKLDGPARPTDNNFMEPSSKRSAQVFVAPPSIERIILGNLNMSYIFYIMSVV